MALRAGTSDLLVYRRVLLEREYDISQYLDFSPGVIVDAGANIGLTSLYFSHVYPQATIIALEPDLSNFELLKANSAAHPNIKPVRGGLWPHSGSLKVKNPGVEKWSIEVELASPDMPRDSDDPGLIPAYSLPALLATSSEARADLVKIDIEGAEAEVFRDGDNSWVAGTRAIVLELHDRKRSGCSQAFYRAVAHHDFDQHLQGMNVIWVNRGRVASRSENED